MDPCTRLLIQPPTDYNIVMYQQPQQVTSPDQGTRNVPTNYETIVPIPKENNFHIIKKGDTLYSLAKKYEVSLKDLMAWNNLTSNLLTPGQKLKLQP